MVEADNKTMRQTFSASFHDTAVGVNQGVTLHVFNNSATGNTAQNGVHGQRFIGSLRDSRPTFKPAVAKATVKIPHSHSVIN